MADDQKMPADDRKPKSRGRRWAFRIAAVGLALGVFVLAEFLCIAFDWAKPGRNDDPFVGFTNVYPLFELNATLGQYEIAASRQKFFAPDSFPAQKSSKAFRIFCLGGSTVQGRPYSIDTSFTRWLELSLKAGDASRDWQVINCGGISYASYRLVPILEECLKYEPDLIILCSGHNEFLEQRTYGDIKNTSRYLAAAQKTASRLRTFTLLRRAVGGALQNAEPIPQDRAVLGAEADPLLDYNRGLDAYHRDETFASTVIQHYEFNVRRMVAMARDAGVPLILMRPASNLKDSPPFKSEHTSGLKADQLKQWRKLIDEARRKLSTDPNKARPLFEQALKLDDRYALTWYQLGKCHDALSQPDLAAKAYHKARELDVCPLRMLNSMEQLLSQLAADTDTPLINVQQVLLDHGGEAILGDKMLVDHVHPSFEGHRAIAGALAMEMDRRGWFLPSAGWADKRQVAYQKHFSSLDDRYFLRGRRMLQGLRAWTQGRADGPPIHKKLKNLDPQGNPQQPATP